MISTGSLSAMLPGLSGGEHVHIRHVFSDLIDFGAELGFKEHNYQHVSKSHRGESQREGTLTMLMLCGERRNRSGRPKGVNCVARKVEKQEVNRTWSIPRFELTSAGLM